MKSLVQLSMTKAILIAIIIAVFYGSTLVNGFVHDDLWQVKENQTIQNLSFLPKLFTGCIAESILKGCKNIGFYYRPLQAVFYAFTYQVSNQPWAFHLANLIYLFIFSLLLLKFFELFFEDKFLPLLATLLVITHPINSEVINWISATPELLMAIFILSMFLSFVSYLKNKNKLFLFVSVLAFLLALFTKETTMLLFFFLPIYVFLFSPTKNFKILSIYSIPVLIYLSMRSLILGKLIYHYKGWYELTLKSQFLSAVKLFPQYLWKFIWPYPLSLQHRFIPSLEFNDQVIFSLAAICLIIYCFYWTIKHRQVDLTLGLSIMIIPLLPVLIFINKLGEFVFSERYLFIPSIGFSLLMTTGISRWKWTDSSKKIGVVIFVICLLINWLVIFNRNQDWKNEPTSYQSIIKANQ